MRTLWIACCALVFTGAALRVAGAQFEPRLATAVAYSDNLQRSSAGELSDGVADVLAGIRALHTGPRLSLDADVVDLHREFVRGTLPSENLPSGYVELIANLAPERLAWTVRDDVGQVAPVLLDSLEDASRENINTFATGPELQLPLPARSHLNLRGQYGQTWYQTSTIDNRRYDGSVGVSHDLLRTSSISAHYEYRRTDYQRDLLYPRNVVNAVFLGYSVESLRTYLALEAGAESLRDAAADRTRKTPHALLALQRRLSPWLTLNVEYAHGFSDSTESFRADAQDNFNPGATRNVQAVPQSFRSDQAYIMLLVSRVKTVLAAEVTWQRESYDTARQFNRRIVGAELAVDRRLSSQLSLAARVRWSRESAAFVPTPGSAYEVAVGFNRQLSPQLQFAVRVLRAGGQIDVTSSHFNEKRATMGLSYTPGAARRERLFDPTAQFRLYERPLREQVMHESTNP